MLIGRRFRVMFTSDQLAYADRVAGTCRAVWNTGLAQRRMYRRDHKWIDYGQQCRELADAKTDPEFGWLAESPGHCLQQTLWDLDQACRDHGTWSISFRAQRKWSPSFRFPEGSKLPVSKLSKRWGRVRIPKFGQVVFRRTRGLLRPEGCSGSSPLTMTPPR